MGAVDTKQYITIVLDKELYGIEISYIHNIIIMQSITRVPKSQPFFKGVINLRGEVIPVMSLRQKFGMPENEITGISRIIIIKPELHAAPVGIIVDGVKEVITLGEADVEKITYDENDDKATYSSGVGKVGQDLVTLLNVPGIIREEEFAI